MNTWLAEMFGTTKTASAAPAGQTKTAQLELFAKLAADEGIDLTTLSPQQVDALYRETFGKHAEEGEESASEEQKEHEEGETPEEEAVEEAAKEEHEEKKAQVAKLAEAELMGQVMAHSFVRELSDIEKQAAMPEFLRKGYSAAKKRVGAAASSVASSAKERAGQGVEFAKKHKKTIGAVAGGTAAIGTAGLGGYALGRHSKKEASAFELLAAQNAVKVAGAAGYDTDQALKLVESVYNLGLEDSEKVAYVEDTSHAIHVRSLEYLERAGYPVNWEEVFGS
jgi:hypothetical protein